jgi:hypothetical protein
MPKAWRGVHRKEIPRWRGKGGHASVGMTTKNESQSKNNSSRNSLAYWFKFFPRFFSATLRALKPSGVF